MGWPPRPRFLLYDRQTGFRAEHLLCCVPEPCWPFFSFSWTGAATFRGRILLLISTQKKIKMQVFYCQPPRHQPLETYLSWDEEALWGSGVNAIKIDVYLEHVWKNPTGLSVEFCPLGSIRGQSRAPGAAPGMDVTGAGQGLCGLRRDIQVGSILCVTDTARKWQKVDFSKLPFVPLLSKFMKVKHPNPQDLLMPLSVCTFWPDFEYLKWLNIKSRKVDWIETS